MKKVYESISVVMPVYNKAGAVIRALNSVIRQSCAPKELLIIDDGSTDQSVAEIKKLLEGYVGKTEVKLVSTSNNGVSSARNLGISLASGDYVAFIDADDEWDSAFLQELYSAVLAHPTAVIYTCFHEIRHEVYGLSTPPVPQELKAGGIVSDYFRSAIKYSVLNSSKIMISKEALNKVEVFPVGVVYGEDLYLWIKLALSGDIWVVPKVLVTIHQQEDSVRIGRQAQILYPLDYYAMSGVVVEERIKPYLWSLLSKNVLFKLGVAERRAAKATISVGSRIFGVKAKIFLLLFIVPSSIYGRAYVLSKKNKNR